MLRTDSVLWFSDRMRARNISMATFRLLITLLIFGGIGAVWLWSGSIGEFTIAPDVIYLPKLPDPPNEINAVYMTSWSAASSKSIDYVERLVRDTEINAVVINVKDYSGYVAYDSAIPEVAQYGAKQIIIPDIAALVARLHSEGIYVIARIVVFQDPVLAVARPELAIHRASLRTTSSEAYTIDTLWFDRKGSAWIDPAAEGAWQYIASIVREVDILGFDEINFDYIRFPSDGDVLDTKYPVWDEIVPAHKILSAFFSFLREEFPQTRLSIDVFGIITARTQDEGIGQLLEDVYRYFDFVSPMVYPSHYAPGFLNFANPAEHPYEIVYDSMYRARERLVALETITTASSTATSTPVRAAIRPWLQDFDLGAIYDTEKVRQQIEATRDALGDRFVGYMLWSPTNIYTEDALKYE